MGLLSRRDPYHESAAKAFRAHCPFITCDAALAEAASFFPDPVAVLKLVARGDRAREQAALRASVTVAWLRRAGR